MEEILEVSDEELIESIQEIICNFNLYECLLKLEKIDGPCLVMGSGGSRAVAVFAAKVISAANGVITKVVDPRDVLFEDLSNFSHVLGITYNNNNHGINEAFKKANSESLKTIAFTRSAEKGEAQEIISYPQKYEKSFISQASTLAPLTVMMAYYMAATGKLRNNIQSFLLSADFLASKVSTDDLARTTGVIEIMSGEDTRTAECILESTITEAGLGIPLVHDKYNFCHGRSTASFNESHALIYLQNGPLSELDELLLKLIKNYYQPIIILSTDKEHLLYGEFYLAFDALFLCRRLAKSKDKSLKKVAYSPVCKTVYRFKGGLR